jgi:hypothetical protein
MLANGWEWRWPTWPEVAICLGIFAVTAVLSVAATAWVIVRLPANYFVGDRAPAFWDERRPFLRSFGHLAKNAVGVIVLIAGMAMLFTPGQGVLTILIGLMLIDFPGKRNLEKRIVRQPKVLAAINAIRRRYGRAELQFDDMSPQRKQGI